MNKVELFLNSTKTHEFCFTNLLDGLVYIYRAGFNFDSLMIDDEMVVQYSELKDYVLRMNKFCREMYGTWYENLEEV